MIDRIGARDWLLDAVYFDDALGVAGTARPIGTPSLPSNNLADVRTICAARNTRRIAVRAAAPLFFDAAMNNYEFIGVGQDPTLNIIDLNGQDFVGSAFRRLSVNGIDGSTGAPYYEDCVLASLISFKGIAVNCLISDIDFDDSGTQVSNFFNCRSDEVFAPTLTINNHKLYLTDWQGPAVIDTVDNAASEVHVHGEAGAPFTLAASCTAGDIYLYGSILLTDNSAGSTVHDYTEPSRINRQLFPLEFWSVFPAGSAVTINAGGGNVALPDVVVAGIPAGATVVKATAYFLFRAVANINAAANKLNGAQNIQVQKGGAGGYSTAIALVDDMFALDANTKEGGTVLMGNTDISAKVTGDDTYNFQWTAGLADLASLVFYEPQIGIKLWYSI